MNIAVGDRVELRPEWRAGSTGIPDTEERYTFTVTEVHEERVFGVRDSDEREGQVWWLSRNWIAAPTVTIAIDVMPEEALVLPYDVLVQRARSPHSPDYDEVTMQGNAHILAEWLQKNDYPEPIDVYIV